MCQVFCLRQPHWIGAVNELKNKLMRWNYDICVKGWGLRAGWRKSLQATPAMRSDFSIIVIANAFVFHRHQLQIGFHHLVHKLFEGRRMLPAEEVARLALRKV